MRSITILTAAAAPAVVGSPALAGDGKAAFEKECGECHYADDFAGETKEDLMGLIKAMAGSEDHPDISGVSGKDLSAIAAYLASAG